MIGRADQLVQTKPDHRELIRCLLGSTWIVKRLPDALHLYQQFAGQLRFVTLEGDVVEFDGSILLGARQQTIGIVSRRSELRATHREIHRLSRLIEIKSADFNQQSAQLQQRDAEIQEWLSRHTETAKLLAKQDNFADVARKQLAHARDALAQQHHRHQNVSTSNQDLQKQLAAERHLLAEQELAAGDIDDSTRELDSRLKDIERTLGEKRQSMTSLKVHLAKAEQRLQSQRLLFTSDTQQLAALGDSIRDQRSQLATALWTIRKAGRAIRSANGDLGESRLIRQKIENQKVQADIHLGTLEKQRDLLRQQTQQSREQLERALDRMHRLDLHLEKLQLEREQLTLRLREDYGIDLAKLDQAHESAAERAERAEIDAEIATLRERLGNIGSVNMDALEELDSLEQRYRSLDTQFQDLARSKDALEKVIHRINLESRRLFLETLEAIRNNFQQLFRQTFGGGRADILLEDGVDVLDAGVDIVATPPGKPEFNNTLLSGGEKALTAVSLLMAIFKFRPSPFCVLDEVDAPFDEANIGHFIDVLKSFLGWTKFIIVTHSKKTMTAATTLYGVTMQESGISKRVSVRFEDVGEDGEIHRAAEDRAAEDQLDSDSQRGVA